MSASLWLAMIVVPMSLWPVVLQRHPTFAATARGLMLATLHASAVVAAAAPGWGWWAPVALAIALVVISRVDRAGAWWLIGAAGLHLLTLLLLQFEGWPSGANIAFVCSMLALAIRAGMMPVHTGASALLSRSSVAVVELGAGTVAAVFYHLIVVEPAADELAHQLALVLVGVGATAALLGALLALAQPTLRGLGAASLSMHGGMLFAAVAAAGRGHKIAALFAALTLVLSMGGFFAALELIERRTGPISLRELSGKAHAYPVLAYVFLFFCAATVAMPGTVGFIADDLLLHALWDETPVACGLVIGASALLAIALLRGGTSVFFGPRRGQAIAPDLSARERISFSFVVVLLVGLGVHPMSMIDSVSRAFQW